MRAWCHQCSAFNPTAERVVDPGCRDTPRITELLCDKCGADADEDIAPCIECELVPLRCEDLCVGCWNAGHLSEISEYPTLDDFMADAHYALTAGEKIALAVTAAAYFKGEAA